MLFFKDKQIEINKLTETIKNLEGHVKDVEGKLKVNTFLINCKENVISCLLSVFLFLDM